MAEAKRRTRRRAGKGAGGDAAAGASAPTAGRRAMDADSLSIPRWLPPVVYGVLTLWIFRAFVFSDDMLFGGDTVSLGYMARAFFADALRSGVFPKWNPLILGGTPFLEALSGGDSLYPTSLLLVLMEPHRALGWKLVLHVFAAGLFMFGWVRSLGVSRPAAFVSGIAYGSAPFLVSFVQPGHDGKLFVTALTPLMFWMAERTFTVRGLVPYAGVALVIALVLYTTHFQMAYFLFGAVGVFYLFRVWQVGKGGGGAVAATDPEGRSGARPALTRLGLFLAAALVGAAAAGVQLLPAVDYVTEHSRRTATTTEASEAENVAYSSSYSLNPEDVLSYAVPEFTGNQAGGSAWAAGTYWGRNFGKDNTQYPGLAVLLLAGLAFFGAPRRGLRIFFAGLAAVALLYALGGHTPVWRMFYEVVPGIGLFRAPDIASFLVGFSAVTLAAFGVDRGLRWTGGAGEEEGARRGVRYLWIATAALGALMLLAASGALLSLWTSVVYEDVGAFQMEALARARPFIARGFVLATLIAAATAATVWAGRRALLQPLGVVAVLAFVVAIDALRIDDAFVQTMEEAYGQDFQAWTTPDPNVEFLLERQAEEPPFRIASLQGGAQDVRPAIFGLELATGHHPNDLARYRDLIGMRGSGYPETLLHPNVLALTNVRYLVVPLQLPQQLLPGVLALAEGIDPVSMTELGGQPYELVFPVATLPRARLVAEAEVVPGPAAVERILDASFDPATTAILAEPPPTPLGGGVPEGEVEWTYRGLNRMSLRVRSDRPALLVLSENWFPSWRATVDGAEAPVLRAYHTLRAVPVGAGEQTVELVYASPLLRGSLALSLVTLALLVGALVISFVRTRRQAADAPGSHGAA